MAEETLYDTPAEDTPPTQKKTRSEKMKEWWASPEGQAKRAEKKGKRWGAAAAKDAREGKAIEHKDKEPKQAKEALVPKGSIAAGVSMVWGGLGWVVANMLGDKPVGEALKLQKGMAGHAINDLLKSKFPAAHVALFPILGTVGDFGAMGNIAKLPILVGLAERGALTPMLEQELDAALVPVLQAWVADKKLMQQTREQVAALEAEAGITIGGLKEIIFRNLIEAQPEQVEPDVSRETGPEILGGNGEVQEYAGWLSPEQE